MSMSEKFRHFGNTPIYLDHHDNEWGRPVHDDNKLFEMLLLKGEQLCLVSHFYYWIYMGD